MAINRSPISEKMTGKISNMIFYEVNGQIRVRAAPIYVKDRKSKAQLRSRGRLGFLSQLSKQFKYILEKGILPADPGCSTRNMFIKINASSVFERYSEWTIDPLAIVCSQGVLSNVVLDAKYNCANHLLVVNIEEEVTSPTQNRDDVVILALWNPTLQQYCRRESLDRVHGKIEISMDLDTSSEWFLYYFVVNKRLGKSSTSRSGRLRVADK